MKTPFHQKLDALHARVRNNKWLNWFTIVTRIALAFGFLTAGLVKIVGERFTSLPDMHPMGAYLEALYHTGYYYPFIGIAQVTAAVLLLIPRTALLGALLYLPIILNICILSLAVRFDGSLFTSPLMLIANVYLLAWDYHRLKFLLPFSHSSLNIPRPTANSMRFPFAFFGLVLMVIVGVVVLVTQVFELYPRNSLNDCLRQCTNKSPETCRTFCTCIHSEGKDLNECLEQYERSIEFKK